MPLVAVLVAAAEARQILQYLPAVAVLVCFIFVSVYACAYACVRMNVHIQSAWVCMHVRETAAEARQILQYVAAVCLFHVWCAYFTRVGARISLSSWRWCWVVCMSLLSKYA